MIVLSLMHFSMKLPANAATSKAENARRRNLSTASPERPITTSESIPRDRTHTDFCSICSQQGVTKPLLVKLKGLLELTQLSRSAAYEAMRDGELKRPIRIGKRSVAWLRSDVLKFIEERVKERDER